MLYVNLSDGYDYTLIKHAAGKANIRCGAGHANVLVKRLRTRVGNISPRATKSLSLALPKQPQTRVEMQCMYT